MLLDNKTQTSETDLDLNPGNSITSLIIICQIRIVMLSCSRMFWLQVTENPNSNQLKQWREITPTWYRVQGLGCLQGQKGGH